MATGGRRWRAWAGRSNGAVAVTVKGSDSSSTARVWPSGGTARGISTAPYRTCSAVPNASAAADSPLRPPPARPVTSTWQTAPPAAPARAGRWNGGCGIGWAPGPGSGPTTRLHYTRSVELVLIPYLGHYRLADLDGPLLRAVFAEIAATTNSKGKPQSPSALQHLRTTLRAALNVAVREELIGSNPAPAYRDLRLPQTARPGLDRRPRRSVATDRRTPLRGRVDRQAAVHVPR
jgi:hypothetical protein